MWLCTEVARTQEAQTSGSHWAFVHPISYLFFNCTLSAKKRIHSYSEAAWRLDYYFLFFGT